MDRKHTKIHLHSSVLELYEVKHAVSRHFLLEINFWAWHQAMKGCETVLCMRERCKNTYLECLDRDAPELHGQAATFPA